MPESSWNPTNTGVVGSCDSGTQAPGSLDRHIDRYKPETLNAFVLDVIWEIYAQPVDFDQLMAAGRTGAL